MAPVGDFYTASQAAKRLKVNPETVRRWARDGLIDAVILPSGRMRFDPAEVERILTPKRAS